RTLEHRLQLARLRRIHVVPDDAAELWRIARSMGFRQDPAAALEEQWRRHTREVRRLHEKLFYRPLLNAVARLDPGEARLTPEAVAMLADDDELRPGGRAPVEAGTLGTTGRHDDADQAVTSVRALRRRELFRTAAADVLGLLDVDAVGEALSDVTASTIAGAL